MKLKSGQRPVGGFSLIVVFGIVSVAFLILAGVMSWITSSSSNTARRGEYYNSLGAAEAATEKVVATMARDFQSSAERSDFQGADFGTIDGSVSTYQGQYPSSGEITGLSNYEFSAPTIGADATYVAKVFDRAWTPLSWKYTNFNGYAASYRVVSNARDTDSDKNIVSAFRQDIQLASIPVFEYGIFYAMDLEFCPSTSFTISGPVHCNGTLYAKPNLATVTYQHDVTASERILHESSPLDPTTRTLGTIAYQREKDSRVSPLSLPIGLANTSSNLHKIIELPPGGLGSDTSTALGQQRYCNKADLIILVYNTNVVAKSGAYNGFLPVAWSTISGFVNTNVYFGSTNSNLPYDLREGKQVRFTEIRISTMHSAATKTALNSALGRDVHTLYVADLRDTSSSVMSAIRIRSATTLNPGGSGAFTIATPNPLYVRGNFNTTSPKPASLVCDSITVLSPSTSTDMATFDLNSADNNLGNRIAFSSRTINAGVITGIVPSDGTDYSGGVENVFRFLEDWSSQTFTHTGSIVVLFHSQAATAPWGSANVYSPPTRTFTFNSNFTDSTQLPPGTPYVRTLIREQRVATQSNSTF